MHNPLLLLLLLLLLPPPHLEGDQRRPKADGKLRYVDALQPRC
jgi:hypothetical protein